ncbi:hypothetical protein [Nonomuraea sp. NPDC049750]|uniref:hypothetical protein n=1 Tax=Nonomuraea sp. NPDC049750 TaxID=3154738 RepID=UPI0033DB147C
MLGALASLGDAISGLGAVLAVFAAIYVSYKTRLDVQRDRDLRILPILAFQPEGTVVSLNERNFNYSIGGVSADFVKSNFRDIPAETRILDLPDDFHTYGQLINYGQGPAFDVRVAWKPETMAIGSDEFPLGYELLKSLKFDEELNTMPSVPANIAPGEEAGLTRIPTFLILDTKRAATAIECRAIINYKDLLGRQMQTTQQVHVFPEHTHNEYTYIITFGDVLNLPAALDSRKK